MAMLPSKETNVIDPEVVKKLLAVHADDPEVAAILKQMEMANQIRGKMVGESKNVFGALAQGMEGYEAGATQKKFSEEMKKLSGRIKQGRGDLYSGLYPDEEPQVPGLSGGIQYPEQGFE